MAKTPSPSPSASAITRGVQGLEAVIPDSHLAQVTDRGREIGRTGATDPLPLAHVARRFGNVDLAGETRVRGNRQKGFGLNAGAHARAVLEKDDRDRPALVGIAVLPVIEIGRARGCDLRRRCGRPGRGRPRPAPDP